MVFLDMIVCIECWHFKGIGCDCEARAKRQREVQAMMIAAESQHEMFHPVRNNLSEAIDKLKELIHT